MAHFRRCDHCGKDHPGAIPPWFWVRVYWSDKAGKVYFCSVRCVADYATKIADEAKQHGINLEATIKDSEILRH